MRTGLGCSTCSLVLFQVSRNRVAGSRTKPFSDFVFDREIHTSGSPGEHTAIAPVPKQAELNVKQTFGWCVADHRTRIAGILHGFNQAHSPGFAISHGSSYFRVSASVNTMNAASVSATSSG